MEPSADDRDPTLGLTFGLEVEPTFDLDLDPVLILKLIRRANKAPNPFKQKSRFLCSLKAPSSLPLASNWNPLVILILIPSSF